MSQICTLMWIPSLLILFWVFKERIGSRGKAVVSRGILKVHFCITCSNLVKIRSTLFRCGIQHLLAMVCNVISSCLCTLLRRLIYNSRCLRQAQNKLIPIDPEPLTIVLKILKNRELWYIWAILLGIIVMYIKAEAVNAYTSLLGIFVRHCIPKG